MLITAASSRQMTGMLLLISDITFTIWGISHMEQRRKALPMWNKSPKIPCYSEICNNCCAYGRSRKWDNAFFWTNTLKISSMTNRVTFLIFGRQWLKKNLLSATFKPLEWNYRMCILSVWSHPQLVNECSFMSAEVSDKDAVIPPVASLITGNSPADDCVCFTVLIPAHWIIGRLINKLDYYTNSNNSIKL